MDYISIYDNLTGKRLCLLENAFDIGYTLNLSGLHTATFRLPIDDPKTEFCRPLRYAEVWDEGERVELFRIVPSTLTRSASDRSVTYTCEHVAATLLDDVLYRYHELGGTGVTTAQCLRYILARQTVERWALDVCEYAAQYSYAIENESLLAALQSVAEPIDAEWMWRYDTTATPWRISLVARPTTQTAELRYGKNLTGITKTSDPANLATRLYMLGYGEGDNQLTLESVTGGAGHIQSETAATYGVVSRLAVDRSIQDADILLSTARQLLAACDRPYVSYSVQAAALQDAALRPGDLVRVVDDEDGISELLPVVRVTVSGVNGARTTTYEVANRAKDVAATLSDIATRQRIGELYSQGSTNIDSLTYADNAGPGKPATLRFYVSDTVMRLNAVRLTFELFAFRSYSSATEFKAADAVTSGGGGGTQTTTSDGAEQTLTSASAPSATLSSGVAVKAGQSGVLGQTSIGVAYDGYSAATSANLRHTHSVYDTSIKDHLHKVTVAAHAHTVTVPAHAHQLTLQSHTHSVTIPRHKHDIEPGIYEGGRASGAALRVDGVEVPGFHQGADLDIIDYLSVDDGGRIRRNTWHTVQIVPDALTRVEAALQCVLFINPRGGHDL